MKDKIIRSHIIIITANIISDIENIITIPEKYKSNLETLLLSNNDYNITLAEEIIKTLYPTRKFVFIRDHAFNTTTGYMIKDPSRHISLKLNN